MKDIKTILVTGGAGFIGSELIRHLLSSSNHRVVNVDKLTYSGNLESLESINNSKRYHFEQIDICDEIEFKRVLVEKKPDTIIHLAAESHVDRSIDGPKEFILTNIVGTYTILEQSNQYWQSLQGEKKDNFRFLHVSTDEVYGDLNGTDDYFYYEDKAYHIKDAKTQTKKLTLDSAFFQKDFPGLLSVPRISMINATEMIIAQRNQILQIQSWSYTRCLPTYIRYNLRPRITRYRQNIHIQTSIKHRIEACVDFIFPLFDFLRSNHLLNTNIGRFFGAFIVHVIPPCIVLNLSVERLVL